MTTTLLVISGVGAVAAGLFYLLWRRERNKRRVAENAARAQAKRANAAEQQLRQDAAAAKEWQAKHDSILEERATVHARFEARRAEIREAGDSGLDSLVEEMNRVLGHTGEGAS